MRIVTVTANPSLDRTVEVGRLRRGDVQRTLAAHVDPGGKGVNVSRALTATDRDTLAVLTSGGAAGTELARLLESARVPFAAVPIAEPTRSNLAVVEADGTVTKLNEAGPRLTGAESEALLRSAAVESADWVAACGSLPPGVGDDFYARLIVRARSSGAKTAVDTSGSALDACLAAGPDLVKPNREELAAAAGLPVLTLGDAVAAARTLVARGAGAVLASLGPDGAILLDGDGVLHAEAPPTGPVDSAVGAGDAALAGFLAAGGRGESALASAVAWGSAAVALPGSRMPAPGDVKLGTVTTSSRLDLGRELA